MNKPVIDKLKLRRIEADANPPMLKPRELSIKEKLYFWWAEVKLSLGKLKDTAIIILKAYIATIVIFALSYIAVHYLRQVLPF